MSLGRSVFRKTICRQLSKQNISSYKKKKKETDRESKEFEKYFKCDGSNMQGNDKSKRPDNVCWKREISEQSTVWVAVSKSGISKPLFRPSKSEAVNSDIYEND